MHSQCSFCGRMLLPLLALLRCHALVISPWPCRHLPPPPPPPRSYDHTQYLPYYQIVPPFQHVQNVPCPSTHLPCVYAPTWRTWKKTWTRLSGSSFSSNFCMWGHLLLTWSSSCQASAGSGKWGCDRRNSHRVDPACHGGVLPIPVHGGSCWAVCHYSQSLWSHSGCVHAWVLIFYQWSPPWRV